MKLSKKILYFTMIVMVYLLGYAYTFNNITISSFATGIIIGFGIGIVYEEQKIRETKQELKNSQVGELPDK